MTADLGFEVLDLEPIKARCAKAYAWIGGLTAGSVRVSASVREHFETDAPALVAEVEKLTAALVAWQAAASGLMDASLRGDAEVERLTHLHALDHSLADQWETQLEGLRSEVRAYLDVTENPPSHAAWIQARAQLEQAVEGGAS